MTLQTELLSPPTNYAVVQLPQRNYPGVVMQGDSLNILKEQAKRMGRLLAAMELEELADEIEYLTEQLSEVQRHYERVCAGRNIALPY
ncbi:DUF6959 family protein [Lysobacter capsici]|uniref:DUF6959 family protein n=1 Tax=Lysobacter capsici TaxID=435897 RepID=UPI00287BB6E6|nr:hypothetical protein [Lysobacter capsici]WND80572.1 hypothetical protein RJ610_25390 [Lysobacter capsici]WND85768.1 hypothetical protein RJ609_25410 [Lysobacter capsici]